MAHSKAAPEMPSGRNILDILVNLLADQESVAITYEIKKEK